MAITTYFCQTIMRMHMRMVGQVAHSSRIWYDWCISTAIGWLWNIYLAKCGLNTLNKGWMISY